MRAQDHSVVRRARFQQPDTRRTLARAVGALRDRATGVREAAVATIARLGKAVHLAHLAPLLTDTEPRVRDAAIRVLTHHRVPEAFGPAWRLYRERAHYGLDRESTQKALHIAIRADADLAIRMIAAADKRHRLGSFWLGLGSTRRLIVQTLASCSDPDVRRAVAHHAQHGHGHARRLCRRALNRTRSPGPRSIASARRCAKLIARCA